MQPNSLDSIIKNNLENQSELPSNVHFDKERLRSSIDKRINQQSREHKWQIIAALLILLLGSSLFLHYQQYSIITKQKQNIGNQEQLISSLHSENENIKSENYLLIDSISKSNIAQMEKPKQIALPQLPMIVINQPIVFQNKVEDKLYIQIVERIKIKETDSEIPELDLPVYYESDRLASNTNKQSNSKSFARKIVKLFKN
ncbi:hypothetical protein [Marinifilum flexuosum]|uniref:Uncharacterized protein n=1 Tax=Marinifilum flexuosum TaxID=1117708 RepID=A0A419WXI6_9BACT|nr:hypothetical protein [Marinifilum flexuosum]RKE00139.1 hypothetical protein BXY64_3140 [Marinifilum flexuosum]